MNRIEHREPKWKFPFVEYSCEKKGGKLPLIIQLHGAGERGNGQDDIDLVDVHGFAKCFAEKDYECIAVMPQCAEDTFWAARVEAIIEFIAQLVEEFDIDEDRIYLTGLSMGGYGTWYTAMAKPDLFAAIAPVCGGGMAWNACVLKMPIWIFHGVADDVVNVIHSDEMYDALKNENPDVKYSRVEGVSHDVWNHAYTHELLEWMLSKKRCR